MVFSEIPKTATHTVRAWAGPGHLNMRDGAYIGETWHVGDSDKDTEVGMWKARMKRGECSRIEVSDLRNFTTITITRP